VIKEIRSYKWKVDKNGKSLEEPVKFLDDAMDALRYAVWNYTTKEELDYSW
jgi:phage terminase large subunit